jgi:hypothetical protein
MNKTGGAATYSLWKGTTGANTVGTEIVNAKSVAAQSVDDLYFSPAMRLEGAGGFLTGGASANTTLSFIAFGEIGLV